MQHIEVVDPMAWRGVAAWLEVQILGRTSWCGTVSKPRSALVEDSSPVDESRGGGTPRGTMTKKKKRFFVFQTQIFK